MQRKTINHSKFKNSGILFELLVRQMTSDVLGGKKVSPASSILTKYFNPLTELGKELQLYRTFFETSNLSEVKADKYVDMIVEQRVKLNNKKLAQEKYTLIKEIKNNYDLKEFLSCRIPAYKIHASIFKTFETQTASDTDNIMNIREVLNARLELIEHLSSPVKKEKSGFDNSVITDFKNQDQDIRAISYSILIKKFNEKYSHLNDDQKSLLREYINTMGNSSALLNYMKDRIPLLKTEIQERMKVLTNKVVKVKINEVLKVLDTLGKKNVIRDNEVTALMIAYELKKEISR